MHKTAALRITVCQDSHYALIGSPSTHFPVFVSFVGLLAAGVHLRALLNDR